MTDTIKLNGVNAEDLDLLIVALMLCSPESSLMEEAPWSTAAEIREERDIIIGGKPISMTPLTKALFLLFWKHPEGIYFKDLPDYRDELLGIYSRVARRDSPELCEYTVDRLIDLDSNSLDTQRYKLRRQIESQIKGTEAAEYCINGSRGKKKLIPASVKHGVGK